MAASAALSAQTKAPSADPTVRYLSQTDEARLRGLFDAIERGDSVTAQQLRRTLEGGIASALGEWAVLRAEAEDIGAARIFAFLDAYPNWPSTSWLQEQAEGQLDDLAPAEILHYFDGRDPVSFEGWVALARARRASGSEAGATAAIKELWIDSNLANRQEDQILEEFGDLLTQQDHIAKVDRQLFDIRATVSRRLLPYLPAKERREAEARIALLRADANGLALYRALPADSQADSGVLHALVRYYRRSDQDDLAIETAGRAPLSPTALRDPEDWYEERRLLTRWALKNARFEDAYTLSAYSGLEEGGDFAEAEFMAGWVALRFLHDPERAVAHFTYLNSGVGAPISRGRAEYWLARAYEAAGIESQARLHYTVAAEFPYTYYGQLAVAALGVPEDSPPFPEAPPLSAAELTTFENLPLVQAMRVLVRIDEDDHFDRFARALDDELDSPTAVRAYEDLVLSEGKYYLSVRAAKVARNNGAEVPEVIYPLYPVPQAATRYAEPSLILGLSRQESEFNPRAYSPARARGLMQMLASTAQITARKEGIPYSTSRLMSDPDYNLTLGAAHLSHLIERFGGSYIMVMAAYNAGPHRVDQWIETYGDPRARDVDPIDWVELIPFSETRNYVMRVTENTQVYRARLNNQPLGSMILADLTRGGGSPEAIGVRPSSPQLLQAALSGSQATFGENALSVPGRLPKAMQVFDSLKTVVTPVGGGVAPIPATE